MNPFVEFLELLEQNYWPYLAEKFSKLKAAALHVVAKIFSFIPNKLFVKLFHLACIFGFFLHIITISQMYFQYSTINRLVQNIEDSLYTPGIAICMPFIDIIDLSKDKMNSKDREHLEPEIFKKFSTKQLMDRIPQAELAITSCSSRGDNDFTMFARKREECNWWFAIDRFIMHDLACYRIQRRQMKNISANNIISSLHMSTIIYTIELSPEFKKTNFMRVIVFSSAYPWNDVDSYPFYSRIYGSVIYRLSRPYDFFEDTNAYICSYSWNIVDLLPRPYDTDCNPHISRHFCIQKCMLHGYISTIGMTPPTEIINASDYKHFNDEDYNDATKRNMAVKISDECLSSCKQMSCHSDFSITQVYGYLDKRSSGLKFMLKTPFSPVTRNRSQARIDLTEYLIYIASCLGSWFGISIVSMNPLSNPTLKEKIQKVKEEKRAPISTRYPNNHVPRTSVFHTTCPRGSRVSNSMVRPFRRT